MAQGHPTHAQEAHKPTQHDGHPGSMGVMVGQTRCQLVEWWNVGRPVEMIPPCGGASKGYLLTLNLDFGKGLGGSDLRVVGVRVHGLGV